jgi:hypothetical protein
MSRLIFVFIIVVVVIVFPTHDLDLSADFAACREVRMNVRIGLTRANRGENFAKFTAPDLLANIASTDRHYICRRDCPHKGRTRWCTAEPLGFRLERDSSPSGTAR